ncbi:hypothetical protein [uncultured virus]|uniref:Uncharacterized protein n=1 Tax=uncultured virus TaxID=340016 RepID=A0A5Q0TWH0_9VIRU|nr:hypothetical protein [uncultured virus]
MSEVLPVLIFIVQLLNFLFLGLLIPFFKHLIDLRLRIERMEVLLDIILKDLEKLKKGLWDGKESED